MDDKKRTRQIIVFVSLFCFGLCVICSGVFMLTQAAEEQFQGVLSYLWPVFGLGVFILIAAVMVGLPLLKNRNVKNAQEKDDSPEL